MRDQRQGYDNMCESLTTVFNPPTFGLARSYGEDFDNHHISSFKQLFLLPILQPVASKQRATVDYETRNGHDVLSLRLATPR